MDVVRSLIEKELVREGREFVGTGRETEGYGDWRGRGRLDGTEPCGRRRYVGKSGTGEREGTV